MQRMTWIRWYTLLYKHNTFYITVKKVRIVDNLSGGKHVFPFETLRQTSTFHWKCVWKKPQFNKNEKETLSFWLGNNWIISFLLTRILENKLNEYYYKHNFRIGEQKIWTKKSFTATLTNCFFPDNAKLCFFLTSRENSPRSKWKTCICMYRSMICNSEIRIFPLYYELHHFI